jgi:hypothetical protein
VTRGSNLPGVGGPVAEWKSEAVSHRFAHVECITFCTPPCPTPLVALLANLLELGPTTCGSGSMIHPTWPPDQQPQQSAPKSSPLRDNAYAPQVGRLHGKVLDWRCPHRRQLIGMGVNQQGAIGSSNKKMILLCSKACQKRILQVEMGSNRLEPRLRAACIACRRRQDAHDGRLNQGAAGNLSSGRRQNFTDSPVDAG